MRDYKPKEKWQKKFAWLPKKSTISNKILWLKFYWKLEIYMDKWGKMPIQGLKWTRILSEHELLIEKLKYAEKQ